MYGDVLRREALLDDSPQLVFRDRRERRVVAIKKGQANVFVLDKERQAGVGGIAVAETEDALVRALPRHDVLKRQTKIFSFAAFEFEFPVFAVLFADFEDEVGLARRVKAKI